MKCFKFFANVILSGVVCTTVFVSHSSWAQDSSDDMEMMEENEDQSIDPRLAAIRAYQAAQSTNEIENSNKLNSLPPQEQILSDEERVNAFLSAQSELSQEKTEEILSNENSTELETTEEQVETKDNGEGEEEEEEEEEDEDEQKILMYLDDVNSTITPNPISSFCFATVKLQNRLRRKLDAFQATLTFDTIPINFAVKNVVSGATKSQEITLVGPACTQITGEPKISIARCSVERMTDKKCQSHFLFQPYTETE